MGRSLSTLTLKLLEAIPEDIVSLTLGVKHVVRNIGIWRRGKDWVPGVAYRAKTSSGNNIKGEMVGRGFWNSTKYSSALEAALFVRSYFCLRKIPINFINYRPSKHL